VLTGAGRAGGLGGIERIRVAFRAVIRVTGGQFTAIESPIDVTFKVDLIKDARLRLPRYTTPGPVTDHSDSKGYEVTTGIGPDLMQCSRTAAMEMIDLLRTRFGYNPIDAYMLTSVCADLRISSIVDQPNWVVSFMFPRIVLE
jgi:acetamidase/formamidase